MNDKIQALKKINEIYNELPAKQRKLASYIISNFEKVINMSMNELSTTAEISEPTIIRFSRMLGFEGYPELKDNLLKFYKNSIFPGEKLGDRIEKLNSNKSIFADILHAELRFMDEALITLDADILEKAASEIASAKKIFLYGGHSAMNVLLYLDDTLTKCGLNVIPIYGSGRYIYYKLHLIEKNDFVIVYKFIKPTNDFLSIMQFLKEKNISNLLVTDSRTPEMINNAKMYLYAKRADLTYFHSFFIPSLITNSLIIKIIEKMGDKAIQKIKEFKEIRKQYSKG